MRLNRWAAALSTSAVPTLLLGACSGSGSEPTTAGSGSAGETSAQNSAYQAAHRGGTLRLLAKSAAGTLDPKINYTLQYWQLYQGVYDGLTAFKQVGGQDSFTVVPDLAET